MRIAVFINKYLIQLLVAVMTLGLLVGYVYPAVGKKLNILYAIAQFVMLYPMMIEIRIGEVASALSKLRFISATMILNFIVSPLLAAALGYIFLSGHPDFAVGLIINGAVPSSAMLVTWTAMAKGNAPLTLIVSVVSLLTGIVLIPICIWFLVGKYVHVDMLKMIEIVVYAVIIPLILGNLTRRWLVKKWGQEKFSQMRPIFPATSAIGMFLVFFISAVSQSVVLVQNPQYVLVITLPLIAFYFLIFIIAVLYARAAKMTYPDMVSLYYSVSGKNVSIALVLALHFSQLTVMLVAIKPIIQISFMTGFFRIAPFLQRYWVKHAIAQEKTNLSQS